MKNEQLIAIEDILKYLQLPNDISEAVNVKDITLDIVSKFTKGFNTTKELWYKDKKKTLAIIALLCMITAIPGGLVLSPALVGIKDSIANGTDPYVAIVEAYKKFPSEVKDTTMKTLKKLSYFILSVVEMPEPASNEEKIEQQKQLYHICKNAKLTILKL